MELEIIERKYATRTLLTIANNPGISKHKVILIFGNSKTVFKRIHELIDAGLVVCERHPTFLLDSLTLSPRGERLVTLLNDIDEILKEDADK